MPVEQYTAMSLNESPSNTSLQQPVGCPLLRVCRVGDGVDDMAGAFGGNFLLFFWQIIVAVGDKS